MLALLAATAALRAPLSTPDSRPAVARRDLLAGFAAAVPVLAAVAPAAAYDSIEAAVAKERSKSPYQQVPYKLMQGNEPTSMAAVAPPPPPPAAAPPPEAKKKAVAAAKPKKEPKAPKPKKEAASGETSSATYLGLGVIVAGAGGAAYQQRQQEEKEEKAEAEAAEAAAAQRSRAQRSTRRVVKKSA